MPMSSYVFLQQLRFCDKMKRQNVAEKSLFFKGFRVFVTNVRFFFRFYIEKKYIEQMKRYVKNALL